MPILRGKIVKVFVYDPQGGNPKRRPVVITSKKDVNHPDDALFGIAITSTLPSVLTEEFVPIPFSQNGRCRTGLRRPSAAKCDWPIRFKLAEITRRIGFVPEAVMLAIAGKILSMD